MAARTLRTDVLGVARAALPLVTVEFATDARVAACFARIANPAALGGRNAGRRIRTTRVCSHGWQNQEQRRHDNEFRIAFIPVPSEPWLNELAETFAIKPAGSG
jgi:hypothetical protein